MRASGSFSVVKMLRGSVAVGEQGGYHLQCVQEVAASERPHALEGRGVVRAGRILGQS